MANRLGLKPWEFNRFTLREFRAFVEGRDEDRELWRELAAWVIAWVTAPHMTKPKQPQQILNSPTVQQVRSVIRARHRARRRRRSGDEWL